MTWDESSGDPTWRALGEALGALVIAVGGLEGTVRNALLNMMGGPHWRRTGLVIEGYSAGQVNERCGRLARLILEGPLQDDVTTWLAEVNEVQRYRNRMLHASWGERAPTAGTYRIRPHGLVYESDVVEPDEVRRMAGRTTAVSLEGTWLLMELQVFAERERQLGKDLSPWQRIGPRPSLDG